MVIYRNAAAVVGNSYRQVGIDDDVNPVRIAGNGLVHGVVKDFRYQMVQRLFVRSADIHAGAVSYRIKSFQNFNIARRIFFFGGSCGIFKQIAHAFL